MITFHQTCKIFSMVKDAYGKPVKTNEHVTSCRVKESFKLVKNKAGEEVVSQIEVTLPSTAEVKLNDWIEYAEKDYPIISLRITRNTLGEIVKKVINL
ncbi:hypothetical protein [Jeotgalibacillus malaysiensis]|uniref:hypothetical protein n=1 Tax=Jeotgalibacillus malaysiensis TaxID=1508404 RepID=UPI0038509BD3